MASGGINDASGTDRLKRDRGSACPVTPLEFNATDRSWQSVKPAAERPVGAGVSRVRIHPTTPCRTSWLRLAGPGSRRPHCMKATDWKPAVNGRLHRSAGSATAAAALAGSRARALSEFVFSVLHEATQETRAFSPACSCTETMKMVSWSQAVAESALWVGLATSGVLAEQVGR